MALPQFDVKALTDAEVTELKNIASLEEQRRLRVASISEQIVALNSSYLDSVGQTKGAQWQQPTGAHNAFPLGWTVVKDSITYESLIPNNVTVPGSDPRWWKDLTTVVSPTEWSGASVAYKVDDVRTFNNKSYTCLQAHTSQAAWTPDAAPSLWKLNS